MKKKCSSDDFSDYRSIRRKFILKMKLVVILICIIGLTGSYASVYSQQTKLDLNVRKATVKDVLRLIEDQSEFSFMYNASKLDVYREIDLNVEKVSIEDVLKKIFSGENVSFKIIDKNIIISSNSEVNETEQQKKSVSGKVSDSSGGSLPGVSVVVKGTTSGVITDVNGTYVINNVPDNATLQFSFVGMKQQEISVGSKTNINVVLMEETIGIEEVVAVGYGTQKKVNLTGSVGIVNSADLEKRTITDTRTALQGKVSGVTIIDGGGAPGQEELDLKIRGIGTLSNADPLVLIDGISRSLSDINPNDIENISILKDAASASIYGSRAANGVVLITTKRANGSGGIKVEYNGYYGVQNPSTLPKAVSAEQFLKIVNEGYTNMGQPVLFNEESIKAILDGTDPKRRYTNLPYEIFNSGSGVINDHNLSISFGNEKSRSLFSMGLVDENGIVENTNSKRHTLRYNNDFNITDRLKFSTDISYLQKQNHLPHLYNQALGQTTYEQLIILKDENGHYGVNNGGSNPLAYLEISGDDDTHISQLTTKFQADYDIIKGLKLSGTYSYVNDNTKLKQFAASYDFRDLVNQDIIVSSLSPNSVNEQRTNLIEQTARALLTYKFLIGNHDFNLLAGFEQIDSKTDGITAYRQNLISNDYPEIALGAPASSVANSSFSDWALRSYFGRLNYTYKEKYLLEVNTRYDGSSKFAKGNKWGFFPSFSFGWRLSKESFMNLDWLDDLKLRTSYGSLGNQNIGNYKFTTNIAPGYDYTFGGNLVPGYSQVYYANKDISWETTSMFDLGVDLTVLKGKLNIVADYYDKKTKDILLTLPIPTVVGLNASETNAGVVGNRGWELSISHKSRIGKLDYNVGLLVSDVKNEVIDLAGQSPIISGSTVLMEGQPMNAFYGYQSAGLFSSMEEIKSWPKQTNAAQLGPGDIKLVDRNKDGVVDVKDRYVMGSNIPRYSTSLNLNLSYKGFDLSALFQSVLKCDQYIPNGFEGANFQQFTHKGWLDRWSPENPNPNAPYPRVTANTVVNPANDLFIRNGGYLRLKNLQIGYNVSEPIIKKVGISNLRIFVTGTNIFTLSSLNNEGYDPEVRSKSRFAYYPPTSTYSVGINVKF